MRQKKTNYATLVWRDLHAAKRNFSFFIYSIKFQADHRNFGLITYESPYQDKKVNHVVALECHLHCIIVQWNCFSIMSNRFECDFETHTLLGPGGAEQRRLWIWNQGYWVRIWKQILVPMTTFIRTILI